MSHSARYRITHHTQYTYAEPVAICQNQLRMMPRSLAHVECHAVKTKIQPEPDITEYHEDYFGNAVCSFAIESLHRRLEVTVHSEVTVHDADFPSPGQSPAWKEVVKRVESASDPNWFQAQEYCFDSPRVRRDIRFADYARPSFSDGRPIMEATLDLTKRIHADFKYDTTATHVDTTTEEAFALKAGVCQDFTHVQIACLRSLGLPARYVSGYLRTVPPAGKQRLVGTDESHAWISVYAGHELGWVDYDPTNARLADLNHIPICIGRDYNEVSPMRGVVIGGGKTTLKVSVDVAPVEEFK